MHCDSVCRTRQWFFLFVATPPHSLTSLKNNPRSAVRAHLEVLKGFLQAAVVIEHHPTQLEGLHVVLVEQQGLLKALSGCFKIAQFPVDLTTVLNTVQIF